MGCLSLPEPLEHDRSMRPAVNCNPSRQMPLEGVPVGPGSARASKGWRGQGGPRERVTVDLRGLGPRLNAYAAAHGKTPTSAIRQALMQALAQAPDSGVADASEDTSRKPVSADKTTKVTLRVSAVHAVLLARRARASETSQGGYVCALLEGEAPAPLPSNHEAAIQALMSSTDHLAVLSADLNSFLRSVGHIPNAELQRYRASLVSVVDEVRKHLAQASALIAEIRTARRGHR